MHAIVYTEIKQIQRAYKSILVYIALMVTARATLGDYGHLINLFLLFPIIASAIGAGVLSQEHSKNYLKYLFCLPVKRWHFFLVKVMISLVACAAFLLLVYVITWVIPPRITIPSTVLAMILPIVFNITSLLVLSVTISLFNYAVCIFSVTFFRSPKMAGNANLLSLLAGLLYLLYCFITTGYKYTQLDYVMIFTPASLILALGGFYLFTLRNPFLNRNPRHLITGILIAALSIVYFAGSTQLISHGRSDDIIAANAVEGYSISPDGEFVFVQTSPDPIIRHGYIFDSSGDLVADLGKNSSILTYYMLWQFNNGKRMIVYKTEKPILSEIDRDRFSQSFVLDLDSQQRYPFKYISSPNSRRYYDYKALNNRTLEWYVTGYEDYSDGRRGLCLSKQNIVTGSVHTVRIPDTDNVGTYDYKDIDTRHIVFERRTGDSRRYLSQNQGADKSCVQLKAFNLETESLTTITLPDTADSYNYLMNNGKCYFVERLSDEHGYSYRVASRAPENMDEIYLTPEELPRETYKEAAERTSDIRFSLSLSPRRKWVQCYYNNKNGQPQLMLLDREGNRVDVNIDSTIVFSPDETRFYTRHDGGIIRIYDIIDQQITLAGESNIGDAAYGAQFLNDKELLYVIDQTPEDQWVSDRYLVRLDLDTMESTPFIDQGLRGKPNPETMGSEPPIDEDFPP